MYKNFLIFFLIYININELIVQSSSSSSSLSPKKFVIVGGGWGGLGAAKSLAEGYPNCDITLLDMLPDPTGSTPFLTPTGKPMEAGTRGFWKDYPNIYDLVNNYLDLNENDVFTSYTNSSFYSPDGLEATAPVFSEGFKLKLPGLNLNLNSGTEFKSDTNTNTNGLQLPSPLGQIFASFSLFTRLPLSDRASMIGLLYAMLDLYRVNEYDYDEKYNSNTISTLERYDRMSAHDLFIRMGISKRLVNDFIKPTLLVGLFKPPEELSAAVTMELLYYYALAHQDSFDVRWIKDRTINQAIIKPFTDKLSKNYNIKFLGKSKVNNIECNNIDNNNKIGKVNKIKYYDSNNDLQVIDNIDGCVLALGSKGMKSVLNNSPTLASLSSELCQSASLNSIDVISVRLWLDKVVTTNSPANVFSRFNSLEGAGGTFFMLDQLQDKKYLWNIDNDNDNEKDVSDDELGSVVACDFYNAGALLSKSDDDLISLLINDLLPSAVPEFKNCKILDSFVLKLPSSVTWFSPGSYKKRPPLVLNTINNLVCAGDWVRMGSDEHGSKGLCQERAYVSGLKAGNKLLSNVIINNNEDDDNNDDNNVIMHPVIEIREDEIQVKLGREVNRKLQEPLTKLGLDSFWIR